MRDCNWRYTLKPARFFLFDARAVLFVLLFLLHIRLWTFVTVVFFLSFFWALEKKGLSLSSACRAIRLSIASLFFPYRNSCNKRKRALIDYQRIVK